MNAGGYEGTVPLHWAVVEHNQEILTLLLNRGADVDRVNHEGCNPLHWAISEGQKEIVKLLLESGSDINGVDGDEKTPLCLAVTELYIDIILFLIEKILLVDPYTIKPDFIEEKIELSCKWDACCREISRMKTGLIPLSSCSYFTFCLEQNPDKLASLGISEESKKELKQVDFTTLFPHYATHLTHHVKKLHIVEQLLAARVADTRYSIYDFYQEKNPVKLSAMLNNKCIEESVCDFINSKNRVVGTDSMMATIREIDPFYAYQLNTRLNNQLKVGIATRAALKKLDIFSHDKVYGDLKLPKEILFRVAAYLSPTEIQHVARSALTKT